MLHRCHVILQDGVGHIANKQIVLLVTKRQKVGMFYRSIIIHESFIGVLETNVKYRGIRNPRKESGYRKPKKRIGVSETETEYRGIRNQTVGIRNLLSGYQKPSDAEYPKISSG